MLLWRKREDLQVKQEDEGRGRIYVVKKINHDAG